MENKFELKVAPIIKYDVIDEIAKEVDEKLKVIDFDNLIVNEDTCKDIKKLRTELKKEYDEYEKARKFIKSGVTEPYKAFEDNYKEKIANKFKEVDNKLKIKIDEVEDDLKKQKEQSINDYFIEQLAVYNETIKEFAKFNDVDLNITLSASIKSLKDKVDEYLTRFEADVQACGDDEELLTEFIKVKHLATAMQTVNSRRELKKRLEEKKQPELKKEEQEINEQITVEEVQAVVIDKREDKVNCTFTVRGTMTQLKQLKEFIQKLELEEIK